MSNSHPAQALATTLRYAAGELSQLLERNGYDLAHLTAWLAMLGSLYLSEVMGFEPCRLCWYQRIAMYPLALILPIGRLRRSRDLYVYVLPMAALGSTLSVYHILIQRRVIGGATVCSRGIPCSAQYVDWLGFVSIPVLALLAFLIIGFATSAARRRAAATSAPAEGSSPLLVVSLTIGAALVLLGALLVFDGR